MNQTPTHQALAPEYRLLVLLVSIGFFMQGLDTTIVNTALPAMAVSLNEDPLQMHSWWWPMCLPLLPVFP